MKVAKCLMVIAVLNCYGETMSIVLEQSAFVYAAAEPLPGVEYVNPPAKQNRAIATVDAGETLELLGTEYKKDYAAYRVRLKDGRVGYLMSDAKFRRADKSPSPSR